MPHIHELIDYTVAAYIVFENKVLLVDHKKLMRWVPIGGHIELDEDPEQALLREIQEECGLEIEIVGEKPAIEEAGSKSLIPPRFLDIHEITPDHRHIGMVYIVKAKSSQVTLAEREHNDIRWFTEEELLDSRYNIGKHVQYYAIQALRIVQ